MRTSGIQAKACRATNHVQRIQIKFCHTKASRLLRFCGRIAVTSMARHTVHSANHFAVCACDEGAPVEGDGRCRLPTQLRPGSTPRQQYNNAGVNKHGKARLLQAPEDHGWGATPHHLGPRVTRILPGQGSVYQYACGRVCV